ncbi:deaminase domain-containing protein [Brevibacillus sp. FSL K6-6036]|uniref:deaminase domain-containing protein n=1 Tax=Brevibacillus sp. FSL K6-6036 TaxID=2954682 RepID=UPI0030CC7DDD
MIRKHYLLLILAMILCLPLATYAADKPKPNMLRADERNDAISGGTRREGAPPDELMRFRIMYATYAEGMWDGRIPGHLRGDGDDLGRGGDDRGKGGDNLGRGGDDRGKGGDNLGKGGDDLGKGGDDRGKGGDPEHGTPAHENTRAPFDPTASDLDPKSGDPVGKGDELKAKEGKPGFWDWLIGGASEALDKGLELWESTVDSVKETVKDAIDTVVDTVKDVATTVVDAVVDAGKWVADHWEVVLVTTAGVALTVGGVFFPPLLPFGVSILVGEGISGVIGYAFGMRGDELLREMALGGVLSAAGFGAGALIGKAATAVARLKPVANALGKASALTSRATSAVRTAVGKGAQAAGAAARWVRQTSVGRAAARLGTQAANAVRSATSAAGKAGNALRSALASTAKQAGGALRAVAARIGQTRLAQSAASVAKNVRSAVSSAGNAVKNSSVYRAVASLGRNTGKGIGKLASNVGSGLRTVAKTTGSKMQSIVQTVKKTVPVRAVTGFTRKAGTQISQGFRQIGSAISRSLATTVLRSKTAGAGEGFAVSVMDDRARGEKVDYRKAVIAAAIGALLVTGGSIGLNKAYSTGQETAQAVVKSSTEQSGSKFLLPMDLQYFSSKGTGNLTYAQKVEMFQARAQAIRDTLPNKYKNYGNVAVADVNISGLKTEFKAHSRIHKENADGFSTVTGEGQFPAKSVNQKGEVNGEGAFPRDNDTERKILEDIANQLGNNKQVKGTIDLFTELPACGSCSDIILKFRQEYPNIKLNVYSGEFKN